MYCVAPLLSKWNHEGNVARSVKFIRLWSCLLCLKWIQKVKGETAFTIQCELNSKYKGWFTAFKADRKRPYANAAIKWSTFQTWCLRGNRTWKVKGTKTTVELEVDSQWHYPHSFLYHYMKLLVNKRFYHISDSHAHQKLSYKNENLVVLCSLWFSWKISQLVTTGLLNLHVYCILIALF